MAESFTPKQYSPSQYLYPSTTSTKIVCTYLRHPIPYCGQKMTHGEIIHTWSVQPFSIYYGQCHCLRAFTVPRLYALYWESSSRLYALYWESKSFNGITSAKREHRSFSTLHDLTWSHNILLWFNLNSCAQWSYISNFDQSSIQPHIIL